MTTDTMLSPLHALADRVGIIAEYRDQTGKETRATSDETRVALLAAMGIDASGEAEARRALEAMDEAERTTLLEPVRVLRLDEVNGSPAITVRVSDGTARAVDWSIQLRSESGEAI